MGDELQNASPSSAVVSIGRVDDLLSVLEAPTFGYDVQGVVARWAWFYRISVGCADILQHLLRKLIRLPAFCTNLISSIG